MARAPAAVVALALALGVAGMTSACGGSRTGAADGGAGGAGGASAGAGGNADGAAAGDGTGTGGAGGGAGGAGDGGALQPFALLVTGTPPGPDNGDPAAWAGVLHFTVRGTGAALDAAEGIPKAAVADPAGIAYRALSSEVFVGNRHGNNAADGVVGSISRFVYDKALRRLTPSGTITGNGLAAVHQLAFNPVSGELFAANKDTGVSRFTFDARGAAVANGVIGDGPARGVLVSADGKRLYVTPGTAAIRQFDLATGAERPAFSLPGGPALHYLALRGQEMFAAGVYDGKVYRVRVSAATGDLVFRDAIDAAAAIAAAFSPDGSEMFVAAHFTADTVHRFRHVDSTDTWHPEADVTTTVPLGGLLVIPLSAATAGF